MEDISEENDSHNTLPHSVPEEEMNEISEEPVSDEITLLGWRAKMNKSVVTSNGEVEAGHYDVVLCVSLKDVGLKVLRGMSFHVSGMKEDGSLTGSYNSGTTIVSNEELKDFPNGDFVHLRLHRQVFCKNDTKGLRVKMDFNLDNSVGTQPAFEIHYVQLENNNSRLRARINGKSTLCALTESI
ncbi:hypothetical protein BGX27_000901 [Mortierella sp. AM989]|nr:hypothetical protein BGX27_000901 [Mortierella sp. AM989]